MADVATNPTPPPSDRTDVGPASVEISSGDPLSTETKEEEQAALLATLEALEAGGSLPEHEPAALPSAPSAEYGDDDDDDTTSGGIEVDGKVYTAEEIRIVTAQRNNEERLRGEFREYTENANTQFLALQQQLIDAKSEAAAARQSQEQHNQMLAQMRELAEQDPDQLASYLRLNGTGSPRRAGTPPSSASSFGEPNSPQFMSPEQMQAAIDKAVEAKLRSHTFESGRTQVLSTVDQALEEAVFGENAPPEFKGREEDMSLLITNHIRQLAMDGQVNAQTTPKAIEKMIHAKKEELVKRERSMMDARIRERIESHRKATGGLGPRIDHSVAASQSPAPPDSSQFDYANGSDSDFMAMVLRDLNEVDKKIATSGG